MTDENTVEAVQNGAQDPEKPAEDAKVPWERFEDVNKRARQAEKELEDLRQRIIDFEERDQSDAEKAKKRAERAEHDFANLQKTVTAMEKGAWVRSAATELGFHDPEDAVAHLADKLARLEDERDARRLVKSLAQSKKHLVREEEKKEQRPRLGRVFSADERAAQTDQRPLNRNQIAAQREMEFAHSLAEELGRFREGWREMGGIT